MVKRCPTCKALWNLESEKTGICGVCHRTLQHWSELNNAPDWIKLYKDVDQYGV